MMLQTEIEGVRDFPLFREGKFPQSPTEMSVVTINPQIASKLNKLWHSRLPSIPWSNITRNRNYICYGAMYDWRYFAAAIWSSPVNQYFDFDTVLELRRFAIGPKAPKYTASWMLGKMAKRIKKHFPKMERLISYQDTDVHSGTIYKAANWFEADRTEYRPWDESRDRNTSQSTADKVRWEYHIRPVTEENKKPSKEELPVATQPSLWRCSRPNA